MVTKALATVIAREEGVEALLFSEFITRRFPEETDGSYIKTWARRFKQGNVTKYMDSQSLNVYCNLIGK